MRHLVLVRHGQSEWNVERRIQGQAGTGLSDLGREQAARTATWLAETYPDALVWSSDLQRCRETVAPLTEALDVSATFDAGLRERDFGAWSGLLLDEVRTRHPELWDRWRDGEDIVEEVGGESSSQLTSRVLETLGRILDDTPDGGVAVVVTHGGPVWHGTHALLSLPDGTLGGVANTSITEIVRGHDGVPRLSAWNQVAHLPVALRSFFRPSEARASNREAPVVGR